ncbi:MAG: VOC family protein [Actinomycetota bacterium]|nr:VOC family protein [Actinomycetota bacterium]
MSTMERYAAGTPSWVDLVTSDPDGARAFYGALFGWEFDVGPAETGFYTRCRVRGHEVAGMVGQPSTETPTSWTTYFATDDADEVAQRVAEAGGRVFMGPDDVLDQGRLVLGVDPTGAVFGVWQARAHVGATLVNEPDTVIWNELATRDLPAALAFYSAVLGVGWEPYDTGEQGPAYQLLKAGDTVVGGAMAMTDQWPAEMPAHWMTYFAVRNAEAAVARAQELGGTVTVPVTDSQQGPFAVLRDPQGGVFSVIAASDEQAETA